MWQSAKPPLYRQMKAIGLNVVYPPRSSLSPLDLLVRHGDTLNRWGPLDGLFASQNTLPQIHDQEVVSSVLGQTKERYSAQLGLSLLDSVLAKLGGAGRMSTNLTDAGLTEVEFSYQNISSAHCDAISIDHFINAHPLNRHVRSSHQALMREQLYVVTEVYRSNQIDVAVVGSRQRALDLEWSQVIDLNAELEATNISSTVTSFRGKTPLTIALKALQLLPRLSGDQCWYQLVPAAPRLQAKSLSAPDSRSKPGETPTHFRALEINEFFEFEE